MNLFQTFEQGDEVNIDEIRQLSEWQMTINPDGKAMEANWRRLDDDQWAHWMNMHSAWTYKTATLAI